MKSDCATSSHSYFVSKTQTDSDYLILIYLKFYLNNKEYPIYGFVCVM